MFQESEIINLILAIVAVFVVISPVQKIRVPGFHFFYTAFFLIVAALIFTVVEGFIWHAAMNFLEHACYAMAALFFAVACRQKHRTMRSPPGRDLS